MFFSSNRESRFLEDDLSNQPFSLRNKPEVTALRHGRRADILMVNQADQDDDSISPSEREQIQLNCQQLSDSSNPDTASSISNLHSLIHSAVSSHRKLINLCTELTSHDGFNIVLNTLTSSPSRAIQLTSMHTLINISACPNLCDYPVTHPSIIPTIAKYLADPDIEIACNATWILANFSAISHSSRDLVNSFRLHQVIYDLYKHHESGEKSQFRRIFLFAICSMLIDQRRPPLVRNGMLPANDLEYEEDQQIQNELKRLGMSKGDERQCVLVGEVGKDQMWDEGVRSYLQKEDLVFVSRYGAALAEIESKLQDRYVETSSYTEAYARELLAESVSNGALEADMEMLDKFQSILYTRLYGFHVLPDLVALLDSNDPEVVQDASSVLSSIFLHNPKAVQRCLLRLSPETLMQQARNQHEIVRLPVLSMIGAIVMSSPELSERLVRENLLAYLYPMLKRGRIRFSVEAAWIVSHIAHGTEYCVDAVFAIAPPSDLCQMLKGDENRVVVQVAHLFISLFENAHTDAQRRDLLESGIASTLLVKLKTTSRTSLLIVLLELTRAALELGASDSRIAYNQGFSKPNYIQNKMDFFNGPQVLQTLLHHSSPIVRTASHSLLEEFFQSTVIGGIVEQEAEMFLDR
ncbi:hypothetical protein BLNAU_11345 [Blattamonas nauphoetae]|uniref:Importin subunit alpha n=1 Tax=Blattamonas nauphoetae TaxID=2049346 RepID=A0ABQ9XN09_9EUKA|nr:hypothetical protein BLNAU_11345 [Blattamonas nauphoetae]